MKRPEARLLRCVFIRAVDRLALGDLLVPLVMGFDHTSKFLNEGRLEAFDKKKLLVAAGGNKHWRAAKPRDHVYSNENNDLKAKRGNSAQPAEKGE